MLCICLGPIGLVISLALDRSPSAELDRQSAIEAERARRVALSKQVEDKKRQREAKDAAALAARNSASAARFEQQHQAKTQAVIAATAEQRRRAVIARQRERDAQREADALARMSNPLTDAEIEAAIEEGRRSKRG